MMLRDQVTARLCEDGAISIIYVCMCRRILYSLSLVSLFNGTSTAVDYLMPRPSLLKKSGDTI